MIHALMQIVLHSQNQFASGGMLLMVIGAIGASLRKIPTKMWDCIVRQTCMSITITDESEAFAWFKYWFQFNDAASKCRRIDAYTPWNSDGHYNVYPSPAPGVHYIWYKGRLLRISMTRSEEKKGSTWNAKRAEQFYVQTIGRDQKFLITFLKSLRSKHEETTKEKPSLQLRCFNDWEKVESYVPRPLSSVILPKKQKEELVNDVIKFKESQNWYENVGVPYKRNYLLEGVPGTGKTSLVRGIAAEFNMNVYVVMLSEVSDSSLARAARSVSKNSILLLEDIDCASNSRKIASVDCASNGRKISSEGTTSVPPDSPKEKEAGVTLSGLLNILDGIYSPTGVLFFMTTNNKAALDSALMRPGRCDVQVHFGPATVEQKSAMYYQFFPKGNPEVAKGVLEGDTSVTMAEFQERLLRIRASGKVFESSVMERSYEATA